MGWNAKDNGLSFGPHVRIEKIVKDPLVLGVEFAGFLSSVWGKPEFQGTGGSQVHSLFRPDYGFSVMGQVGLKVCPKTTVFLMGGPSWTKATYGLAVERAFFDMQTKTTSGWGMGAGLRYQIREKFFIGMRYQYTSYNKVNLVLSNRADSVGTAQGQVSLSPLYHNLLLSLDLKLSK